MGKFIIASWPGCAVGSAVITPDWGCHLAGYTNVVEGATSIVSDLEVNHLVTSVNGIPFVLVSIDILFSSDLLSKLIFRKLKYEIDDLVPSSILIQASHTHSAPSVDKFKPNLGKFDRRFILLVAEKLCQSIMQSIRNSGEGVTAAKHGRGVCTENVYRRKLGWSRIPKKILFRYEVVAAPNEKWPVDHDIRLSVLLNNHDKPVSVFWSYPCHAVSSYPGNAISSDFPGYVRSVIREAFKNESLPILYFPGFSGDVRPKIQGNLRKINLHEIFSTPFIRKFSKPSSCSYEHFKAKMKQGVAEALTQAIAAEPIPTHAESSYNFSVIELSELINSFTTHSEQHLKNWQVVLPPIKLSLFNAEISSAYSDDCVTDGFFPSGCADNVFGYLPTDQQISKGGYEVSEFFKMFGVSGSYKSKINKKLEERFGLKTFGDGRE